MPNMMKKSRTVDNPYQIYRNSAGWEWRILKSWHTDISKPEARAMCAVSSPYTYGDFDYGDVYWREILEYGVCVYSDPNL